MRAWYRRILKQKNKPGRPHTPSRAWRYTSRLWLENLEDRTLLSTTNPFYALTTLASTGGDGQFTSFGNLPSINNQGRVAFVTNGPSGNGIYLAGQGELSNVTATFTSNNDSRTYGRGVAINDTNAIVATDHIGTLYYVRLWDGNSFDQDTDLLVTPSPVSGSPGETFSSAQTFTSINNNGDTAFVAFDATQAARYVLKDSGGVATGPYVLLTTDANGAKVSPRPILTAGGQVLYVTPDGNMYLATTATNRQFIAGSKNGFDSIDPGADVSADGRVVVFTGDRGNGPGLFAAYQGPSGWQIVRLAGEGLDGFDSFDATSDVAVNSTWSTDRGVTIAFKGHNTTLNTSGIFAVRLSFFGADPAAPNPITATSVYASGVMPVALDGAALDGSTISDVELGQGINSVGRGQIAFWAQTAPASRT